MALLDLLSFFYNDFKYRFAFFPFAFNKNTLAVGRRGQPQRHFISAVRTFYFSNKLTFLKKHNKTAPGMDAALVSVYAVFKYNSRNVSRPLGVISVCVPLH